MAPKWHFVLEINEALNKMGEGAKTVVLSCKPSGQSGRGVDRFGVSAPCWLLGCQISKYPTVYNIRLT
jgi:hypothetical protein